MRFLNHKVYAELSTIYSQSHRYYHTIEHINQCLGEYEQFMDKNPSLFFLKREVYLALWFHDVVYNPHSKLNEENSVEIFSQWAIEKDLSINEDVVKELILGTKTHSSSSKEYELEHDIVNDIDLSILGQPENIYLIYRENIRKEYKHVPVDKYYVSRTKFVEEFLNKKNIYSLKYFQNKYEAKAKKNLESEYRFLLQGA